MSTRAEEVSTQALSPESIFVAGLALAAGAFTGASTAAETTDSAPKIESIVAANSSIRLAILAGLIALNSFRM